MIVHSERPDSGSAARILFLFSDTGGGHRAAAQAIDRALKALPGGSSIETQQIDAFASSWFPVREGVASYGTMLKVQPSPYPAIYHLTNGRTRFRVISELGMPFVRRSFRRMLAATRPNIVVSVHPLLNTFARRLIQSMRIDASLVTVITDLVTIHHAWTTNMPANQYVVASAEAARVCTSRGIPADRVHNLGLPIRDGFTPAADKCAAKELVGLDPRRRVLLVMSGGEGGGKLSAILRRIAGALRALKLQVVAICGRNDALRARLEAMAPRFGSGAQVLGFVDNVADYMRAADALLSKAGPGTIVEAAASGLPIIVCDYISGQEAGNLGYVEARGAGVVALEARDVSATLRRMFGADPSVMAEYRRSALESARPHAADDIARFLMTMLPEPAKDVARAAR